MSPVLALAARQMDAVRVPLHIGIDHHRHSPLTPLSTPSSTPVGSHRSQPHRSPSLAAGPGPGLDAMPAPSNPSAAAHKRQGSQGLVCLCAPAPKIPRPRNAFILYRQHHQAQVTADNPRLSNPDISKIIGGQWKMESDEVKQTWKRLADEEKQRHQNQYPHYRYQPRRSTKPQGSWPGASPSDDQARCPKCNGKSVAGPQTPSTPVSEPSSVKLAAAAQGPSLPRLDSALSRRTSFDLSPSSSLPSVPRLLPSVRDMHLNEPSSPPDMKRRRADDSGNYHAVDWRSSSYPGKPHALASREMPSSSGYARTPLPELRNLARPQSGHMPPPLHPPPSGWLDKDPPDNRRADFDESLRLPPLQASVPAFPSRGILADARQNSVCLPPPPACGSLREGSGRERQPQAKTLKDAIMSIPLQKKIAVLAGICQPIPPLAPDSNSAGDTRGAFISIEGADPRQLREVGDALEAGLAACGDYLVRVWRDDKDERLTPDDDDMNPLSQPGRHDARRYGDMFEPYINAISAWQKKSRQIGRHVTGKTQEQKLAKELRQGASSKTPVALARDGFSLTIADRYACAMPIVDMYAPADHWQWMATLWRGTVSPDLIIYVMSRDEADAADGTGVELSARQGLITVKLPPDTALDEATSRRLTFEVLEWMRRGSFRHEVPQGWRAGAW